MLPLYGGFPVKFVTHIGKPIPYDPNLTPEELQVKVRKIIYSNICQNNIFEKKQLSKEFFLGCKSYRRIN